MKPKPRRGKKRICYICGKWVDHEEKNCPDRIQIAPNKRDLAEDVGWDGTAANKEEF